MKKMTFWFIFTILFVSTSQAQMDNYEQTVEGYLDDLTMGSSSYLIERGKSKDMYLPRKSVDNNINTAWVEGRNDEGLGDFLIINLKDIGIAKSISIFSGFAMSDGLYKANNRPKGIRLIFFQSTGKQLEKLKSISDFEKHKIIITNDIRYQLKDMREFQEFDLPDYKNYYKKFPDIRMAIVIESVYRGAKHNDTCISEVRFYNEKGVDLIKIETDNIVLKNKGGR